MLHAACVLYIWVFMDSKARGIVLHNKRANTSVMTVHNAMFMFFHRTKNYLTLLLRRLIEPYNINQQDALFSINLFQ